MRIQLKLNRITKQRMLPMDYQYYISAWIYKVLKQADADYANFLHNQGHGTNPKRLYKLFCFERLNFGKPKLWKEQKLFEIAAHDIGLKLSFDVEDTAANFIKGLFLHQEFYLGNRFNGIDFKVVGIEALAMPVFNETEYYRTITPWVVSIKEEDKKYATYLKPDDADFVPQAIKHLVDKFNYTQNKQTISCADINLQIASEYKRSGYVSKPGSKDETRVVGNLCEFKLTAPIEVHQMIWNTGICERSSSGFGWVEKIEKGSTQL